MTTRELDALHVHDASPRFSRPRVRVETWGPVEYVEIALRAGRTDDLVACVPDGDPVLVLSGDGSGFGRRWVDRAHVAAHVERELARVVGPSPSLAPRESQQRRRR